MLLKSEVEAMSSELNVRLFIGIKWPDRKKSVAVSFKISPDGEIKGSTYPENPICAVWGHMKDGVYNLHISRPQIGDKDMDAVIFAERSKDSLLHCIVRRGQDVFSCVAIVGD